MDIDLEAGTIDGEDFADLEERCEELEAMVDRHARTMAKCGLDFIDADDMVIVDRDKAIAYFNEMLADLGQ